MSVPITSSVARYARERPAAAAVIEVGPGGSQRSWTFAELDAAARRWSATLAGLGVRAGEPVAYQLPNVLDFAALSLGTLMLGAVCEPLMPIFRERELAFMLRASGARVLVVPGTFRGHDHAATATALRDELPSLRHVVALDDMPPEPPATPSLTDPRPEMTAQLLFTSGSTGEPKGVLQTHASLDRAAAIHVRHFGLTGADVIYVPSPLAHQTGFLYGMWIALRLGATQVIQTIWEPETAFDAMAATGVSFVQAATPFLADLVRVTSERERGLPALRTFVATGAAIPRELARHARTALGAEVGGAFGTTESCLGAAFRPGEDAERAWSTDGRALKGITLRITDDHGRVLPPGEEGNFELFTPTLFKGYLNRPDLTAQALTADGYYRTGDLARIDADGYLHITGRVKDVINRGGEKVPVVEVEQVLYAHPAVREVAVVAMPDDRLGERACAFVVLEPGRELEFDAMQRHLETQRVAKPYWPERLELVDELPRTPSGKIQKFVLRDQLAMERKAVPR